MKDALSRLLPENALSYDGPAGPAILLGIIAAAGTVRSLIHMLAPDGGAHSIAGIAVMGTAGVNLVALFGQWGASQPLLAVVQ